METTALLVVIIGVLVKMSRDMGHVRATLDQHVQQVKRDQARQDRMLAEHDAIIRRPSTPASLVS